MAEKTVIKSISGIRIRSTYDYTKSETKDADAKSVDEGVIRELTAAAKARFKEVIKLVEGGTYGEIIRARKYARDVELLLNAVGDTEGAGVVRAMNAGLENTEKRALNTQLRKIGDMGI